MKGTQALLAAVATALVVMPIAIAGASGGDASASAKSTRAAKQLKALKAQSAKLAMAAATLATQVSRIEAKVAALEGKPAAAIPTTLPPSGAAGGDLTGTFPNPQLGANTVATTEIIDGSVNSPDISNDTIIGADISTSAVGPDELANASVHGQHLGMVTAERSPPVTAAPGTLVRATVNCTGAARLLGGGFEWANQDADNTISVSSPSFADDGAPRTSWVVTGKSVVANVLFAEALCLNP